MNRIEQAFQNKKAFIPFITAGDPGITYTEQFIHTMVKAGASLIEIGIPFSDPVAEGPVIQAASERALANGVTIDDVFQMVARLRLGDEAVIIPLVFMTYANPVYVYGLDAFFRRCQEVGVDGIIMPDVPYEEQGTFKKAAAPYGVSIISLVAPTSAERLARIAKDAEGFVYCVSSLGVTGMRDNIQTNVGDLVKAIKEHTDKPVAVGFGINTPEQAADISRIADGVIVGSAIVNYIGELGPDADNVLYYYVKNMVMAVSDGE